MKKLFLVCLCLLFVTGCSLKYRSVGEYSKAMKNIRNNNDYTITFLTTSSTNNPAYVKEYIKGNK